MMSDDNTLVLVDFVDERGQLRRVTNESEEDLAQLSGKSRDAVEKTLSTIDWVATKAKAMLDNATDKPDEVTLEFGISISTKAGVIVMQAEGEFHIKATITWKK